MMLVKRLRKRLVKSLLVLPCQKVDLLGRIATYVSENVCYHRLKRRFIANGKESKWDESVRARLVERFERIDENVTIRTSRTDGLFLAEALLSLECYGSIVECGCFAGGSTSKLSIIAKLLGRELFVFDSFEGLPEFDQANLNDYSVRLSSEAISNWRKPGQFAMDLELVKANVGQYGEPTICTYHKGWFRETLTEENLPDSISLAFTDVDIASSARECFVALWPRLSDGGVYFSHDVIFIKVLQALLDEKLWRDVLQAFPPVVFGAGGGLCDSSRALGFLVKGRAITAEYINGLTLYK